MQFCLRQHGTSQFIYFRFRSASENENRKRRKSTALPKAKNSHCVSPIINTSYAVASSAGGLEGPGTLWVTLQNPFLPAGCGGCAATTSGKREILGRLRLPKPHHRVSPDRYSHYWNRDGDQRAGPRTRVCWRLQFTCWRLRCVYPIGALNDFRASALQRLSTSTPQRWPPLMS